MCNLPNKSLDAAMFISVIVSATSLTSCHISFAEKPSESPDIVKQGHSDTRTELVSCAPMANVTGKCPFAGLQGSVLTKNKKNQQRIA